MLAQCFAGVEQRRAGDVNNAVSTLRLAMRNISGQLNGVVKVREPGGGAGGAAGSADCAPVQEGDMGVHGPTTAHE